MAKSINGCEPPRDQARGMVTRRSMLAIGLAAGSGVALAASGSLAHEGHKHEEGHKKKPRHKHEIEHDPKKRK